MKLYTDNSQFSPPKPMTEYSKDNIQKMAVLFTDIVGSTQYFKTFGDVAGRKMLQRHQDIASLPIIEHSGVFVKTIGDSLMAYFLDPKESVRAAVKIQQRFMLNNKKDPGNQIHVRISVHYGLGIIEEDDIFGNVVNISAKILPLVDGGQIRISLPLYDQVCHFLPLKFNRIDIIDRRWDNQEIPIYEVLWDEDVVFESTTNILLYLKPILTDDKNDFKSVWEKFINTKDNLWKIESEHEKIFKDNAIGLIINNSLAAVELAKKILLYLKEKIEGAYNLPVQLIIDSGPYFRAEKIFVDNLKVNWDSITLGEIYISSSAYRLITERPNFSTYPLFNPNQTHSYYKIIFKEEAVKNESVMFIYQNKLIEGEHPPCFYCGSHKHLLSDCPSKKIRDMTFSLDKLGYLSFNTINKLFYYYLTNTKPDNETFLEDTLFNIKGDSLIAHNAFYELKTYIQLRFFRNIWDSTEDNWGKVKEIKPGKNLGGRIWLAFDCIFVSKLNEAENILKTALKEFPQDYRVYCVLGFLNLERTDFRKAQYYFEQALSLTTTKTQKIFILLLLSRINFLEGNISDAERQVNQILFSSPNCDEAIYQDIIFKMHKGIDQFLLVKLVELIKNNREYYVKVLIDPEFAPFANFIHPVLIKLLNGVAVKAKNEVPKSEAELKKITNLFGENDSQVAKVWELWKRITELISLNTYFAYVDIISHTDNIVTMTQNIIKIKKKKIFDTLDLLEEKCNRYLAFSSKYSYPSIIGNTHNRIVILKRDIIDANKTIKTDTPDHFVKALKITDEFTEEMDKIDVKIKLLRKIKKFLDFMFIFLKRTFIYQTVNLCIGMAFFPIITYYLVFIISSLTISNEEIFVYQKNALIIGGILAELIALISSLNKFYPE
ncbi:MAG: hypothetical protein HQK76_07490 [Desulfobacterales bacterium]|nr:hypothetical protein [Desulfobacterales bacterium]